MKILVSDFGEKNNEIAKLFTLTNSNNMSVSLTNYGALVVSILVPDKNKNIRDVVLGFDNFEDYLVNHCYFGATIGRNGNRTHNASFYLNGIKYELDKNEGNNNLHSGFNGYNKRFWNYEISEKNNSIKFSLFSPDNDQGFPGNFNVSVTYTLTENNELKIDYSGKSDKDTIANLTNHSYFNLDGNGFGSVLSHSLWINSNKFVVVDNESIPTGELMSVKGTPMDFTKSKVIGDEIESDFEQLKLTKGYDHSFILDKSNSGVEKVAILCGSESGITMEVFTDCLCLQFYAGNYINDVPQIGKNKHLYECRSAICLETGFVPDAINQENFTSPILKANEIYNSETIYKFVF